MIPNRLQKQDTIGLISPSSAVTEDALEEINRSILLIEGSGYHIKFAKNALSNTTGYGASAKEKADDINQMFNDEQVNMIWAIRGGGNSNSVFEYLDYETIKKHPKILLGYSDTTSLANIIYAKTGLITFSGETFKGLTGWQSMYSYQEVIKRLEQGSLELGTQEDTYETIQAGCAEGILVGGNLTLMSKLVCGKYAVDFKDKILFLEELGYEADPEMVSNALYYMKQNYVFDQIKGLWLGDYTHPSNMTLEKIVQDTLGNNIPFPVIKSYNFGHIDKKTVIPIGTKAQINTDIDRKVQLLEHCVK